MQRAVLTGKRIYLSPELFYILSLQTQFRGRKTFENETSTQSTEMLNKNVGDLSEVLAAGTAVSHTSQHRH